MTGKGREWKNDFFGVALRVSRGARPSGRFSFRQQKASEIPMLYRRSELKRHECRAPEIPPDGTSRLYVTRDA